MNWYLQSLADHDTHRGTMNRGVVNTECGLQFTPRTVAFGAKALPGRPVDPDQVCPECQRAGGAR
ncbi:MAG: hypothetical protein ACRDTD_10485 [Pseudonocardiaceae bacterium]